MIIHSVSLKLSHTYCCERCGVCRRGDTERLEIGPIGLLPKELAEYLGKLRKRAVNMPVGWSSHEGGKYTCPTCTLRIP